MALVKTKPTSAGRRHMVKVVTPGLHTGKPFAALTEKKNRGSGRNNNGHITCRHKGGGSKRAYRLIDFLRNKDGISELYISYFKDGKFSVDEQGYNLRTTRCYDRIEWNPTGKNFKSSGK